MPRNNRIVACLLSNRPKSMEPTGIEPVTSRMPFHAAPGRYFRKPALSRRYETHHSHLMQHIPRFTTLCVAYVLHREMTARTGDNRHFVNPSQARSCAAEPRWGRRKAQSLLPAQDAALGPLGAFLGMPPTVPSPLSRPWVASTGLKLTEVVSDITGLTGQRIIAAILDGERDPAQLARLRNPPTSRQQSRPTSLTSRHPPCSPRRERSRCSGENLSPSAVRRLTSAAR